MRGAYFGIFYDLLTNGWVFYDFTVFKIQEKSIIIGDTVMTLIAYLPADMVTCLERNYQANAVAREVDQPEIDHKPVVKLIVPTGRAVWLLTEFDRQHGVFFGYVISAWDARNSIMSHCPTSTVFAVRSAAGSIMI